MVVAGGKCILAWSPWSSSVFFTPETKMDVEIKIGLMKASRILLGESQKFEVLQHTSLSLRSFTVYPHKAEGTLHVYAPMFLIQFSH